MRATARLATVKQSRLAGFVRALVCPYFPSLRGPPTPHTQVLRILIYVTHKIQNYHNELRRDSCICGRSS
ncbi:unnamed protein product [Leptosia nina]|uniref:Secreted protein n=1 Tax=Leptosia nina TaxID=320188 RepID=A0AAV1JIY0_9NEOP